MWGMRRRWLVPLAVAGLVLVAALVVDSRVRFNGNVEEMLPHDGSAIDEYRRVSELFSDFNAGLVDVSSPERAFSPDATAVADALQRTLEASPLVAKVQGRVDFGGLLSAYRVLLAHRADLFSAEIAAEAAICIRREAIVARLYDVKRQASTFPDPTVGERFLADPFGLDQLFLSLVPSAADLAKGAHFEDGRLWSADGHHLLLIVHPTLTEMDSRQGARFVELLDHAAARIPRELHAADVRVAHFSRYRAAVDNEHTARRDALWAVWVSLVLVAGILYLSLGSLRVIPRLFLPPLVGGVVALALLSLLFHKVFPVVLGFGSVLLGISIDYGVHFFSLARLLPTARARRVILRPLAAAVLTTAAGFFALLSSSFPTQRQIGAFAGIGALVAAAFAVLYLPLLVPRSWNGSMAAQSSSIVGERWFAFTRRHRRSLLLVLVGLTVVAVVALRWIHFESDIRRFNALSPSSAADQKLIVDSWGNPLMVTSVAVPGSSWDEALREVRTLAERLGAGAVGGAGEMQSIIGILPDIEQQVRNRDRWKRFWSSTPAREARRTLTIEMGRQGFDPTSVDGFWRAVGARPPLLDPEAFTGTPLANLLAQWVGHSEDGRVWALVRVAASGAWDAGEEVARIRRAAPSALVADSREFVTTLSLLLVRDMVRVSLVAMVLVAAILVIQTRSVRTAAVMLAILVMALLWTLGAMALLGISINLMNCTIAVFVFGLTIDYMIFLAHGSTLPAIERGASAGAVTTCALTTVAGFGALVFARHPALATVGSTAVVGVLCGLSASLLGIPVLLPGGPGPVGESSQHERVGPREVEAEAARLADRKD